MPVLPTLANVREAVRKVLAHPALGHSVAKDILKQTSRGRTSIVPELYGYEWPAVIAACERAVKLDDDDRIKTIITAWFKRRSTVMPPMKIKMMLHFATTVGPYPSEGERTSTAYVTFVRELLRDGMIERTSREQREAHPGWGYKATPRGQCYIKALTDLPLPVRTDPVWTMPA